MTIRTREAWLHDAVDAFRPWFAEREYPLPRDLRVSVGFPLGNRKAIGQCWFEDASADQLRHIFISPVLADTNSAQGVLATLLHELAHAALPVKTGHKGAFTKLAGSLGLVKPWTATKASAELLPRLLDLSGDLGEFPHGALSLKIKPHRRNPYVKCSCAACGFYAQVHPKQLDKAAFLICPACQEPGWGPGNESPEDPTGDNTLYIPQGCLHHD